ncbi:MAG: hypothetical protein WC783_04305 [Candidatus Paceibacterota bacterium]|jgi:hypothetical protein
MVYYIIAKYNKKQTEFLWNDGKWGKRPKHCKKPLDCSTTCKTCKFVTRFKYKKDAKATLKSIPKEKHFQYMIWKEEATEFGGFRTWLAENTFKDIK